MVQLDKIYTRGGDSGQTSLGDGSRVAKHDVRVAAYGTVDEANAVIGLARLHTGNGAAASADAILQRVQNDLFDLGADLCFPEEMKKGEQALRVSAAQILRLEAEIDEMNGELDPLRSFVLPGGSPAAAFLHMARTVCRRAERLVAALAARPVEPVSAQAVGYINRLSDFLFVAARYANDKGASDVLWVPGQNR